MTTPATNWIDQSVTNITSKNGIIMDDTVCLMDDSTYTMDDATETGPSATNWNNQSITATNWN